MSSADVWTIVAAAVVAATVAVLLINLWIVYLICRGAEKERKRRREELKKYE